MQKWEYKKISREMDLQGVDPMTLGTGSGPAYKWTGILGERDPSKYRDEMRRLSRLGNEGWELVSVLYEHTERKFTYTYYLKRPIM